MVTFSADGNRPLLRGYVHLAAAIVAPFALVGLLLVADSPRAYVSGAVFGTGLILLYATSASYHVVRWRPRLHRLMRRVDQSMIFVFIAATYTPFCLQALSGRWGTALLLSVWLVAAAGVVQKLTWAGAPRWLDVGLYLAIGWVGVVAGGELLQRLSIGPALLMVLGGLLFSGGGLIYGLRRPDPLPHIFGYHEIFHVLVVAGTAVFYTLIAAVVLPS